MWDFSAKIAINFLKYAILRFPGLSVLQFLCLMSSFCVFCLVLWYIPCRHSERLCGDVIILNSLPDSRFYLLLYLRFVLPTRSLMSSFDSCCLPVHSSTFFLEVFRSSYLCGSDALSECVQVEFFFFFLLGTRGPLSS